MNTTRRAALITGASAGIGAAFARHLAAEDYDVLLVARRAERLEELATQLHQQHGVRAEVFAADLTHPGAPAAIMTRATELDLHIDVLINNAGLSASAKFSDTPWDSVAGEIQLMVTAVTELMHRAVPGMKQRGWGRIINLSSLAAMSPPGEGLLYTGNRVVLVIFNANQHHAGWVGFGARQRLPVDHCQGPLSARRDRRRPIQRHH
jgi:short-subunit dehydrogenase